MKTIENLKESIKNWTNMNQPSSATWEEWRDWRNKTRKDMPVRWFLLETIPDAVYSMKHEVDNLYYKVRHRTFDKYNVIKIRSLEPGYYDIDQRMLHGMFSLLEEYVEIELAHLNTIWLDRDGKSSKKSARENGLEYLDEEIKMPNDEDTNPDEQEVNKQQAENAKEIKEIYLWWKDVRPNRPDPYEVEEDISKAFEMEMEQHNEDTEMLIRLIKVRGALWT